jgi:hypothetical protein
MGHIFKEMNLSKPHKQFLTANPLGRFDNADFLDTCTKLYKQYRNLEKVAEELGCGIEKVRRGLKIRGCLRGRL